MYKIGSFSRQVGIPVRTIHTWERRYGLLKTVRGNGGYRFYDDNSIREARLILDLLSRGVSLGAISGHPQYQMFHQPAASMDIGNSSEVVLERDVARILVGIRKDLNRVLKTAGIEHGE